MAIVIELEAPTTAGSGRLSPATTLVIIGSIMKTRIFPGTNFHLQDAKY
jgi:hypothetical protein